MNENSSKRLFTLFQKHDIIFMLYYILTRGIVTRRKFENEKF